MPHSIAMDDGQETHVITVADLAASEAGLHRWVVGSFITIVTTALALGVLYGKMVSDIARIGARVEEIRVEGSVPLRSVNEQLAVIRERQNINTIHIEENTVTLLENADALARIEARLGLVPKRGERP